MEEIKQKIKDKEEQIIQISKILNQSKNELKKLKKELYLKCEHKFVYTQISSGQYAEFEHECEFCGYSTPYLV